MRQYKSKNMKRFFIFVSIAIIIIGLLLVAAPKLINSILYTPTNMELYDYNYLGAEESEDGKYLCTFELKIHNTNDFSIADQNVVLKINNDKIKSNELSDFEIYCYCEKEFTFELTEKQKDKLEKDLSDGSLPKLYVCNKELNYKHYSAPTA
jgi:hypothetical protein